MPASLLEKAFMPRTQTTLTVFVASPNDVAEERNCLECVIRELNVAWSRELGIALDLVRWESHSYPGFGRDAQAVINEQIPNDYDLFIGIIWHRIGTPTGRAESGTVEEFERAKARFDENPRSVHLMVYFKDAPIPLPPSQLDSEQIAGVARFRSLLSGEGGLFWSFESVDDFERLARLHLTRYVQRWSKENRAMESVDIGRPLHSGLESIVAIASQELSDEPGVLDLMEESEGEFTTLLSICERIGAATSEIGEKIRLRTHESQEFSAGPSARDMQAAKRLIARAAADLSHYAQRIEAELPLFSRHLSAGMSALVSAVELSIDFEIDENDRESASNHMEAVRGLISSLSSVADLLTSFQASVAGLPRLTAELNKSKRRVVTVLQQLIAEFNKGKSMAREAELSFASIISRATGSPETDSNTNPTTSDT